MMSLYVGTEIKLVVDGFQEKRLGIGIAEMLLHDETGTLYVAVAPSPRVCGAAHENIAMSFYHATAPHGMILARWRPVAVSDPSGLPTSDPLRTRILVCRYDSVHPRANMIRVFGYPLLHKLGVFWALFAPLVMAMDKLPGLALKPKRHMRVGRPNRSWVATAAVAVTKRDFTIRCITG